MTAPAPTAANQSTPSTWQIVWLCALAFALMGTYAVARPASESLFVSEHGADALPNVWMLVAVAAVISVVIYNRLSVGRNLGHTFAVTSAISAAGFALAIVAYRLDIPGATYALYICKDLYIVLLVEIFWSIANSAFKVHTAKWVYGLFCAMGGAGGILTNLSMGEIAAAIGTERALWFVPPLLLGVGGAVLALKDVIAPDAVVEEKAALTRPAQGFEVVTRSRYLLAMLFLIVAVQVAITLIDFQFFKLVETTYESTDDRTRVIGYVYASIDAASLVLQGLTPLFLRFLGVPGTLFTVPLVLAATVSSLIVFPQFTIGAVAKVASKAFDYSVFRAAKEILYIPLDVEDRTQGKAIIDMLTYRVAKGGASALVRAIRSLASGGILAMVGVLTLVACAAWFLLTVSVVRRYRARVGPQEDATS